MVGDIIADVDGADVLQQPFKVVSDLIKGKKGTVVTIGFFRPKADTPLTPQNVAEGTRFEVKVRREEPGALAYYYPLLYVPVWDLYVCIYVCMSVCLPPEFY